MISYHPGKSAIQSFDVDFQKELIYAAGVKDEYLSIAKYSQNQKHQRSVDIIQTIRIPQNTRLVKLNKKSQEIYLGHYGGLVSIIDLKSNIPSVVCKIGINTDCFKAHKDDVTQIQILEEKEWFVTASKDMHLRIWQKPKDWLIPELNCVYLDA